MGVRRAWRSATPKARAFVVLGAILTGLSFLGAVGAGWLSAHSPVEPAGDPYLPPGPGHWFGTDKLGYDLWSRVLHGTRGAWQVGLVASALAVAAGVPLGLASGYYGGRGDAALLAVMDALCTLPPLLLAITLMAVAGPGAASTVVAIFAVFVPQYFRIARSHARVIRGEPYVESARSAGVREGGILVRYVLRNALPSLPPLVASNLAQAILVHASLSFLGLGTTPPAPNLGYEISQAQLYLADGAWWWAAFPGLAIVAVIVGFSLLSEGLTELLDPLARRKLM